MMGEFAAEYKESSLITVPGAAPRPASRRYGAGQEKTEQLFATVGVTR